ncbi:MAG: GspH/FimT family pseudopilin [candidate division Zixibacteria bacterium]|nr:GspH/FimT family pseudopilin [candidate division Zixibacteria bacterium]
MRYKKGYKGMTLLELMIGVVVLGVIAAMAAPQFGGVLPRLKFKNKSRDIVSDMRLARSDAISQRVQFGLFFNFIQDEYIVFKDQVNPDLFTYEFGDSVIKTISLGRDISMYYCSFSNFAIVFKPDGSASSSGNVTIKNNQGSDLAEIDVLASTGRVRLTFP